MNNEQTFSFKFSKPIRFEDLASRYNLLLVFQTRDSIFKSRRAFMYCHFKTLSGDDLYEHDRCIRAYWHGDGNTHLQAMRDYAKLISGKTLIAGSVSFLTNLTRKRWRFPEKPENSILRLNFQK